MIELIKESLWKQFGASIDMLHNAISAWPHKSWDKNRKFFFMSYHVLIFLDYYLSLPPDNFKSLLPFTLSPDGKPVDESLDDIIPDRIYTKEELLGYLQSLREKCKQVISGLDEQGIAVRWIEKPGDRNYAIIEMLLYNMRHVQHHTAQLNTLLRKEIDYAPGWVSRAKDGL